MICHTHVYLGLIPFPEKHVLVRSIFSLLWCCWGHLQKNVLRQYYLL